MSEIKEENINTKEEVNTPDSEALRKANRYFFSKVGVNLLLMVIGTVCIALFLTQMQTQSAVAKQRENSTLALSETISLLEENEEEAADFTRIFHDSNQDVLDDLNQMFSSGMFDSLADADNEARAEVFSDIVERSGVEYLFMMSMDGRIVISPDASLYGTNPAARGYMTQENVNDILKGSVSDDGTIDPVLVGNQYGSYYFYSMPYTYGDNEFMLVLGADASVLDVQISTLTDVSVVLSRASISNDGFIFAVDTDDGLFLYYKNGDEILTGQSAYANGLSEAALADGYTGTQTINGTRYYCVSKIFGEQTVVCAVAETAKVATNNKYVLFWSIFGFIAVMMLCLAYAVIVRNDFVRRAVVTERKVLRENSENPIYFDKSIFQKVFPLMLAGVLVMYCISFYTQTLLEISEGVDRSQVALDEVTGRYSESNDSREIIQDYYNDRSLSKARLIAFLIEEDPSVLNADTDNLYTVYDDDGSRVYLKDDEGNILRSVSSSARLQELCDANDIESVYIFDQDGHTIGTNTANWYFTISRNEEDQSYPFLQVLDGRADSYVQEPMTNDLGELTQFIGVRFNYYTTKNADGETVYVSRYAYENGGEAADNVTAHTSLLQIGLDNEMSSKLLGSTDVSTILSTNMLSGGFIVMFDNSDEHLCVYSPNEASIGKSAAELGVSANAFSGDDYYGFSKVNGVEYFQYFRYSDGYYAATALPKNEMYQTRGIISFLTALISFLLVLILSMTVTLTDKEEEQLYETVNDNRAGKGINSAIFNIVLPSGRSAATTKAAARWDNRRIPWSGRSPEQKLLSMVGWVTGFVILYIAMVYTGVSASSDSSSFMRYIISGGWDRGSNVFALSMCVITLAVTVLAVVLFRIPVRLISSLLGTRGETIGHLMLSVVKYGGVLGAFFYCLYLLGIESGNLLASAGILSLVIGLGAQSLIKDILAGIFIVFEGEFRVGDIVTINDYRGTVMDIGLRTTKIMAPDGNIKIYNNSEISGVLNMTQESSFAACRINIEYGQDIGYVEEVLARELPEVAKAYPQISEGPALYGVSELGDSGVQLLIGARCREADIYGVIRAMNKEVLQIFYRNGINVPFPQMTISPRDTAENTDGAKKRTDDMFDELFDK